MTTQTEALKLALEALQHSVPTNSQNAQEQLKAITAIKEALAQPEHEKERCVGCEACIDTACGRDECPKGWPKASQPEQEPVAWRAWFDADNSAKWLFTLWPEEEHPSFDWQPLYTTTPQRTWVGLTGAEVLDVLVSVDKETVRLPSMLGIFARAIEAKLKEKNNEKSSKN